MPDILSLAAGSDVIDLFGGAAEVYFTGKDGIARNVGNLAFQTSTGGSQQVPNLIESIKVEINILKFTKIEVAFAPPIEQAVNIINSGLIGIGFSGKFSNTQALNTDAVPSKSSFGFNEITVRLHYGGKKSPYFKAILNSPDFSITTDSIGFTCKGIGMLFQSTKTSEKKVFNQTTRLQIIKKLLDPISDRYDLSNMVDPTDSKAFSAMNKTEDLSQSETDWREIKTILKKTNCVMIEQHPDGKSQKPVLKIFSKDFLRKKKKSVLTFVVGKQINPNKGIYPILGMETVINNIILGQTIGVQKTIFDADKKQVKTDKNQAGANTADQFSDSRPTADGSMSGGSSDSQLKTKTPVLSIPSGLEQIALGALQEATDAPLQYKITTVGLVDLLPGQSVNIEFSTKFGKVKFLSGTYDLYAVEHVFSKSGVETNLTLAMTAGLASVIDSGVEKLQVTGSNLANGSLKTSTPIGNL